MVQTSVADERDTRSHRFGGTAAAPGRSGIIAAVEAEIVGCRALPATRRVARGGRRGCAPRGSRARTTGRARSPGFGDPARAILVVGLAPAAHGGNRTGRVFTGDRSGDFLYAALHRAGLANQPTRVARDDGLRLTGAFVTAVVRCAPPGNRPHAGRARPVPAVPRAGARRAARRPGDRRARRVRVGRRRSGRLDASSAHRARPRPRFGHGAEARVGPYRSIGSYHPSQQNTFTGRLTAAMLDAVVAQAREIADGAA